MNLPFLKSVPGEEPVIVEGTFRTTAKKLFEAWTQPEAIKTWFGVGPTGPSSASIDLRPGGMWEFTFIESDGQTDTLRGEYVEIEPDTRLIFTWEHERQSSDGKVEVTPQSLVTLDFDLVDNGVRLRLIHERIVKESGRLGVCEGWNTSFTKLSQVVEETPLLDSVNTQPEMQRQH